MGGAAVGVIASTAVVTRLQNKRLNAGAVLLHNALVAKGDPTSLTREEVVDLGNRYRCSEAFQYLAAPLSWCDATQAAAPRSSSFWSSMSCFCTEAGNAVAAQAHIPAPELTCAFLTMSDPTIHTSINEQHTLF